MSLDLFRSLLYPLGFVANLLFGLRFFMQWIQSEKKGKSTVSPSFWYISCMANALMACHAWIQLQFPLALIQGVNGMISYRNLELIHSPQRPLKKTLFLTGALLLFITLLFLLQGFWAGSFSWMRAPSMPWSGQHASHAGLLWHLLGFSGMLLFASRFWIQWAYAEKYKKSYLGPAFWKMSLVGATFSLAYFIRLGDWVNIIGSGIGLIPYFRNLILTRKQTSALPFSKKLFLFAGEQSGDLLGGALVKALKVQAPDLTLFGIAGPTMRQAGVICMKPMENFQVMGFIDVFKALPQLYQAFQSIKKTILTENPKGVVFIDYPDFNMKMARALRQAGYKGKLIHYVCPTVWAWRKKRVYRLAETLDKLLTILPFEKACFQHTPLAVTYVGHPLIQEIKAHSYDPAWEETKNPLLALFPGSRLHEIERNLPLQWEVAKRFSPDYEIAISVARPELEAPIRKIVGPDTRLVPASHRYELMKAAKGALATSGTVVLELGLQAVPTVVTYHLPILNYYLGRYAFKIRLPFYTLVNILSEKEVFPEFIHKDLDPELIYQALLRLLNHPQACVEACYRLSKILQEREASREAAKEIIHALSLS